MPSVRAEIGSPDLRIVQQLGSAAFQGDPTGLQDEGPIRDFQGLGAICSTSRIVRPSLPHGAIALKMSWMTMRREPKRRLVEQQQPGLAHQRACRSQAFAARHRRVCQQLLPALSQAGEEFEQRASLAFSSALSSFW